MAPRNRRNFLKASGISILPAILPALPSFGNNAVVAKSDINVLPVKFFGDGEMFEPHQYLAELTKAYADKGLQKDRYGVGGVVEELEREFCRITGKEAAIFMPSGTMANQFAIATLSGDKAKVIVQDTSHIYRDEADAAQTVFEKRLIALGKEKTYFTLDELKSYLDTLPSNEVFSSGIGAVSIENPVRRTDGRMVPIGELKAITAYCKSAGIPLHLDGARLYLASAWSGISIAEYSSLFDTVYISLYKYLGASGGAILCGDKSIISKMPHLMKVHGGSMYGNWTNAAMALNRLKGFEQRMLDSRKAATTIFAELNKMQNFSVEALQEGTNVYSLQIKGGADGQKIQQNLANSFNIRIARPDKNNRLLLFVNETILYKPVDEIIKAFRASV